MSLPALRPSRWTLLRAPLLMGAAGVGAFALLYFRDPHVAGSYGFCPFKFLTGLECPGCGGLRAMNHVANFEWGAALSSNVFAVVLVASLFVLWLRWTYRRARGDDSLIFAFSPVYGYVLLGVMILFTVVRNTPWGAGLAP